MRTTDPNTIRQFQLFRNSGGVRVATQQFEGIYDASILDTDATNPLVNSAGQCRVLIPALSMEFAFGPCMYPSTDPPDDGTDCVVGFIANSASQVPSIGVRILELVGLQGNDAFSLFLLMGA